DLWIFEHAVFDHPPRAAPPFLGRLEAEDDRAGDLIAPGIEHPRRAEQDRRVAVVPAGVHRALDRRAVFDLVLLLDRQRVHVGAQEQRLAGAAAAQDGLDAGDRDPGAHVFEADGAQPLGDDAAGARLLESQFRMAVEVAARLDQLRQPLVDLVAQGRGHDHGRRSFLSHLVPGRSLATLGRLQWRAFAFRFAVWPSGWCTMAL